MALIKKIFKQVDPDLFYSSQTTSPDSVQHPSSIEIQYLGTAGFVIKNQHRTVVLDPFVTRPNLWTTLSKPLVPNKELIQNIIPHADDVLIGHAHYDHILDAPDLCLCTGARLIGSTATMMVGRAAGLPEQQLVETKGREDIASGPWTLRGLPSIHGKAAFGRVPLPGDMTTPPKWPARFHTLKHGLVLNWLVDTGELTVVHIDSADFIEQELSGLKADIVCLCATGRQYRPHYVKDVVRLLQPKWIIACHWDTMITPIDATPDLLPQVDLVGFLEEIKQAGCEPILLPILGKSQFNA